jgi:hypothetical protein
VPRDFFASDFFHESSSPNLLKILVFSENLRRKSRCTTGNNGTGGKFTTSSAGVVDIGGKFVTGVNDTCGNFATDVNNTGVNDTGHRYQ